ncbi:substrate-binding periplasmic protein [Roseateles koreensis]|uniref:Transporter substrate-binding domain-containing protein n=1 Tax=Roseateles koreensis TaxID=2987526 RepID=A0ABT5KNK4_9BURK|nr:transporter substrate-binding domain-containing protein [Roseateles koreensis]MDC8784502.1 transporter substrate-binding domain-containing protein [Roseateles koreensis]
MRYNAERRGPRNYLGPSVTSTSPAKQKVVYKRRSQRIRSIVASKYAMKSIAWLVLVVAPWLAVASRAAEKVVIYGDEDYAPYSYLEAGHFKGIYVDALRVVAERLKPAYEIELKSINWRRGLLELKTGASFALFPPYINKSRHFIQAYSVPLYTEEVVIFCRQDAIKSAVMKFPDDFAGLTIGVNAGFMLSEGFTEAAKNGKFVMSEVKGNERNLRMLASNHIHCYANDRDSILYSLRKLHADPAFADVKISEVVRLAEQTAHIAYSATSAATFKADFIEKMNAELDNFKRSGEMNKIVNSYRN